MKSSFKIIPSLQAVLFALVFGPVVAFFDSREGKENSWSQKFNSFGKLPLGIGYYLLLFVMPIHWGFLFFFHFSISSLSAFVKNKKGIGDWAFERREGLPYIHSLTSLSLLVLPLIYVVSLVQNLSSLVENSVQAPSSVFQSGFIYILLSYPILLLVSVFLWKKKIHFSTTNLVHFYLGVFVLLFIPFVFYKFYAFSIDTSALLWEYPWFFDFSTEKWFRQGVKYLFRGAIFLYLLPYLWTSPQLTIFLKRSFNSAMYLFWLALNMLVYTGEGNIALSAVRKWAYQSHQYSLYQNLASFQLKQTPSAFVNKNIYSTLAELQYQLGKKEEATSTWNAYLKQFKDKEYMGGVTENVNHILNHLKINLKGDAKESVLLDVPVVVYRRDFDLDWYGALSAVAYQLQKKNPLTDNKLKELLDGLSYLINEEDLQMSIPTIGNIPVLLPVLSRLKVKSCAVFMEKKLMITSLKKGTIPLIYSNNTWIPIVGYDAQREGFLYYDYSGLTEEQSGQEKMDFKAIFEARQHNYKEHLEDRFSFIRFVSDKKLMQNILNYGGVGVLVGDTSFINPLNAEAAYEVEKGDVYYQSQNNFVLAAQSYKKAYQLFPHWVSLERMVSLKKYYQKKNKKKSVEAWYMLKGVYGGLEFPEWYRDLALSDSLENQVKSRIRSGQSGLIILEEWVTRPLVRSRAQKDSLLTSYKVLSKSAPYNRNYIDTLARVFKEVGNYSKSEQYYKRLLKLYPVKNNRVALELAWVLLLKGEKGEISDWLVTEQKAIDYSRYFTLKGASLLYLGKKNKAKDALLESLKSDKTIGETHELLALYYEQMNQPTPRDLHLKWASRCKGLKELKGLDVK